LLTVDIKRIFFRFKDNGKALEASWLPDIRPLGNKSVRGLSGKRQKSQQVSGVASAVPFLGETLPEKGKWEKEAARLVPVPGAGTMDSREPPARGRLS